MSPEKSQAIRAVQTSEKAVREAGSREAEINSVREKFLRIVREQNERRTD